MKHGFIDVAAVTPTIKVADTEFNSDMIRAKLEEAVSNKAKIIVFPELCITGYTCNDLFRQQLLLDQAKNELKKIVDSTKKMDCIAFVGLPLAVGGKIYNCAAAVSRGKLLGIVPKTAIPNYSEFYEARYFSKGIQEAQYINMFGENVPFGTNILL